MDVHVKHSIKADLDALYRLCTETKALEDTYAQLGGSDVRIKREGRAPNVKLRISRRMPAEAPAAIRRFVPAVNDVSHTEEWRLEGAQHIAAIEVEIKGVPVKIRGTKALRRDRKGSVIEWKFAVTSGVLLVGKLIAGFAGEQLRETLEDEYEVLRAKAVGG
jgi:Protein of unknown function (DUF2505)